MRDREVRMDTVSISKPGGVFKLTLLTLVDRVRTELISRLRNQKLFLMDLYLHTLAPSWCVSLPLISVSP